jgi:hypothetical protein
MDVDEPRSSEPGAPPLAIETMLGYAGSIGTALWYEIGRDRGKVGRKRPRMICFLTFPSIVLFDEPGNRRSSICSWRASEGVRRLRVASHGCGDVGEGGAFRYRSDEGRCQERLPRLHIFLCFSLLSLITPHSFVTTITTLFIPIFHSLTTCLYMRYSAR